MFSMRVVGSMWVVGSMLVDYILVGSMVVESMVVESMVVESMVVGSTLVGSTLVGSTLVGSMLVESMLVGSIRVVGSHCGMTAAKGPHLGPTDHLQDHHPLIVRNSSLLHGRVLLQCGGGDTRGGARGGGTGDEMWREGSGGKRREAEG